MEKKKKGNQNNPAPKINFNKLNFLKQQQLEQLEKAGVDEAIEWIKSLGQSGECCQIIKKSQISGDAIVELDSKKLQEIELTMGDTLSIIKNISKLSGNSHSQSPSPATTTMKSQLHGRFGTGERSSDIQGNAGNCTQLCSCWHMQGSCFGKCIKVEEQNSTVGT